MKASSNHSQVIAMLESIPVLTIESPSQQHALNRLILPCICFWYPICHTNGFMNHSKVING